MSQQQNVASSTIR